MIHEAEGSAVIKSPNQNRRPLAQIVETSLVLAAHLLTQPLCLEKSGQPFQRDHIRPVNTRRAGGQIHNIAAVPRFNRSPRHARRNRAIRLDQGAARIDRWPLSTDAKASPPRGRLQEPATTTSSPEFGLGRRPESGPVRPRPDEMPVHMNRVAIQCVARSHNRVRDSTANLRGRGANDGILVGVVVRGENLDAQGSFFPLLKLSIQLPLDNKLQNSGIGPAARNRELSSRQASCSRTAVRLGEKSPF